MAENPWLNRSMKDFWFLNCPECTFRTNVGRPKAENNFRLHARTNHPLSWVIFSEESNVSNSKTLSNTEGISAIIHGLLYYWT